MQTNGAVSIVTLVIFFLSWHAAANRLMLVIEWIERIAMGTGASKDAASNNKSRDGPNKDYPSTSKLSQSQNKGRQMVFLSLKLYFSLWSRWNKYILASAVTSALSTSSKSYAVLSIQLLNQGLKPAVKCWFSVMKSGRNGDRMLFSIWTQNMLRTLKNSTDTGPCVHYMYKFICECAYFP